MHLATIRLILEKKNHFPRHSGLENLEKSRPKKLVKSNKSIWIGKSFKNFFPVQKLIFGHFWNCKKKEFGQKNFFREIDLFDFTSFFGLDFSNFLARRALVFSFSILTKANIETIPFRTSSIWLGLLTSVKQASQTPIILCKSSSIPFSDLSLEISAPSPLK